MLSVNKDIVFETSCHITAVADMCVVKNSLTVCEGGVQDSVVNSVDNFLIWCI